MLRSIPFRLTKHAEARCHQRGITSDVVQLVLKNFDQDHHAGGGAEALSISRGRVQILLDEGTPIALLERASRTVLVVAEDGSVVTAINRPTSHDRRWRRRRRSSR